MQFRIGQIRHGTIVARHPSQVPIMDDHHLTVATQMHIQLDTVAGLARGFEGRQGVLGCHHPDVTGL